MYENIYTIYIVYKIVVYFGLVQKLVEHFVKLIILANYINYNLNSGFLKNGSKDFD